MLGNFTCWAIALALLFSKSYVADSDYKKFLLAMGFILLANVCKFVDVYNDIHSVDDKTEKK